MQSLENQTTRCTPASHKAAPPDSQESEALWKALLRPMGFPKVPTCPAHRLILVSLCSQCTPAPGSGIC